MPGREARAKRLLRRAAGPWAAALLNFYLRLTSRRAGVALLYHTVDSHHGDPAVELVPPVGVSMFRYQLRHLGRFYRIVPSADFLAAVRRRRRGERFPVCVTFDDDAPQHVSLALPLLREFDVPATFFLSGGGLDGSARQSSWWERLQRAFDRGATVKEVLGLLPGHASIPPDEGDIDIHAIGRVIEELTPAERGQLSEQLLTLAGADPAEVGITREEVRALSTGAQRIGFHTRRHRPLAQLAGADLEQAMDDGREMLAQAADQEIDQIAYPHGSVDSRVVAAARRAGFRLGFTTVSRAVRSEDDPLLISRFAPMGIEPELSGSRAAFALRLVRTLLVAAPPAEAAGRRGR